MPIPNVTLWQLIKTNPSGTTKVFLKAIRAPYILSQFLNLGYLSD